MAGELGSYPWASQPSPPQLCCHPNKKIATVKRNHEKAAEDDDSVPGVSCLSQSVQEFTMILLPSEHIHSSM